MFSLSFAWKFQGMPLIIYLMLKSKLLAVILGLLLSFVTIAADNSIINDGRSVNLTDATFAVRVTAPKAVVYADENMLSPLGYIANGKALLVGNPRRKNRELVPLVIYGRLAFIEIKDIRYENSDDEEYNVKRGAPREHNFDMMIKAPEEKLSEGNSFYLTIHTYSAGEEVKNTFATIDGADKNAFIGFNLNTIHRKTISRVFWGVGIDYSGISSTNMKFNYWMFSPMLGYTPIKNRLFLVDLYASLDLGVNTVFDISNNFDDEPSGFVWGPQLNARIVLFPSNKYHLAGGIGYRKYNISGLESLNDINAVPVAAITSINSFSLFIGAGMEFD
jgi:hypothetical protein